MKSLCEKTGNGICLDCPDEYKKSVWCRKNIADYVNDLEWVIKDMVLYIVANCKEFETRQEVRDYFEFSFMDNENNK